MPAFSHVRRGGSRVPLQREIGYNPLTPTE
nr:MAG TPA: hypothetical protein [Caudoviricetes sp.]